MLVNVILSFLINKVLKAVFNTQVLNKFLGKSYEIAAFRRMLCKLKIIGYK